MRPAALAALIGLVADGTLGSSGAKTGLRGARRGRERRRPGRDRRGARPRPDRRRGRARGRRGRDRGRAIPQQAEQFRGGQGEPDGVLRRSGHEGDRRPRGAATRPAASARGDRPWLTAPSCSRPARCRCRPRCSPSRASRSSTTAAPRSSRPTARCCASSSSCSAPRTTCCCSRPRARARSSRSSPTSIEPGDRVLCVTAGAFGDRWVAMARAFGADVTVLECEWGRPPDPARRGRGDGRRVAAAGRRRALRDLHRDGDRHPGDRRAHARPQLPARDRRRLEPRRGADRDRRLGPRRRRLGHAEGHVDAARALVRERLAGGLGAQPRDRRRRASTSTGSARSTPRTAAAARSRPRPRPSMRSTSRSTSCSRRAWRRSGSARARWPGASAPACSPRASSSTRPTTSRARS